MSNSFVGLSNLTANSKYVSFRIVLPKSEFQLLLMSKPAIGNDFESAFYHLSRSTGCGRKNTPIWEGHSFG